MLVFSLKGGLQRSRGAAVAAAIGAAMSDYKSLAAKIHIHVMQVIQVGDLWTAIIQIALEPDMELILKEKEKERHIKQVSKEYKKEEIIEKPELKARFAGEENQRHASKLEEPPPHPAVHIYIPSLLEPGHLYEPHHYIDHPDYNFHFLEAGSSFWKASLKITPDVDFYEMTANIPQYSLDNESGIKVSPAPGFPKHRNAYKFDPFMTE